MNYGLLFLSMLSFSGISCPDEKTLFICEIKNESFVLCANNQNQVVYNHIKNNIVDFVYPTTENPGHFYLSITPNIGGAETHLSFKNRGYEYYLYEINKHTNEDSIFKSGVLVKKDGVMLLNKTCVNERSTVRSLAYNLLHEIDMTEGSFEIYE